MKLLHVADLHLDSPLRGLARHEGAPLDALRGATRLAFARAVDLAIAEDVGAVVIAGDLYDGDRDDYQTAVYLQRQLHRLRDAGIGVVVAYGNHDAESEITRRLALPDNTAVLPTASPGTVVLEDAGVAFHGQSYPTRAVTEDLSTAYPAPVPGVLNVGVLHTSLDGRPGHASYAPCTVDGLVRRGYPYWALGHVHRREELRRDGTTLVFPGNVCGRDVGETGPKGATVVEHDGDRIVAVAHHALAPVEWHRVEADAAEAARADDVAEAVLDVVRPIREHAPPGLHAVRVSVHAGAPAHAEWTRDPAQWEAQLRADAAGGDGRVWLERIEVAPAPSAARPVAGEAMAAVAETLALLRDEEAARALADEVLAGVRTRFGADLEAAARLGAPALDPAAAPDLVRETEALLLAELEAGG